MTKGREILLGEPWPSIDVPHNVFGRHWRTVGGVTVLELGRFCPWPPACPGGRVMITTDVFSWLRRCRGEAVSVNRRSQPVHSSVVDMLRSKEVEAIVCCPRVRHESGSLGPPRRDIAKNVHWSAVALRHAGNSSSCSMKLAW